MYSHPRLEQLLPEVKARTVKLTFAPPRPAGGGGGGGGGVSPTTTPKPPSMGEVRGEH